MKIEDVDWAALSHAYGRATDVPDLLRALRSDDPDDHDDALYDMYGSLCHQGSVYSATAAAVPFLVDVVLDVDSPARPDLLRFLGDICHGYDVGLPAVRAALAAELPRLVTLLADDDEEVRFRALWLLSAPELAAAADDVHRLTADGEPSVRSAAWLCLGDLAPGRIPDTCPDDVAAVRLAWALAAPVPGRADLLVDLLTTGGALARLHEWTGRVTDGTPLERCLPLLRDGAPRLLEVFCAALVAEQDEDRAMSLYETLLAATFTRTDPDAPTTGDGTDRAVPDERQRRVLAAIADSDTAWAYGNILATLSEYGIEPRFDQDEFVAAYGTKRAIVVCPRQVPAAARIAAELGRQEWLDTPFVFGTGWTSAVGEAIPEDPADFPPEVMEEARRITKPMLDQVVMRQLRRNNFSWAFYPQLGAAEAGSVFAGLGFELTEPDLGAVDEPYEPVAVDTDEYDDTDEHDEPDDDRSTTCVPYAELPDAHRTRLAAFADIFADAGWSEVRQSHDFARRMGADGSTVTVTPLATARRFRGDDRAEVGFHVERPDDRLREYVRLVLISGGVRFVLRLSWDDETAGLFTALAGLDFARPANEALVPVIGAAGTALYELEDGFVELTVDQGRGG